MSEATVERRRNKRFRVQEGAIAVIRPKSTELGPIIDLSESGLAFRYIAGDEPSSQSIEHDILFGINGFYLEGITIKTISDYEIQNEESLAKTVMRRRSVEFQDLTDTQKSQLEYFLRNHTIGQV